MHAVVDLIVAAQRGDQAARAALCDCLWPRLVAIIRIELGPLPARIEFEDLTQEAWLAFDRAVNRFDPAQGCEPVTYLGRRAVGAARDALRAHYAPRHSRQPLERDPVDGHNQFADADRRMDLEGAVASLSDHDKSVVKELLDGWSARQIAARGVCSREHVTRVLGAVRGEPGVN